MRRHAMLALVLATTGCGKLDKLDHLESMDKNFEALVSEVKALRAAQSGKPPAAPHAAPADPHGAPADPHAAPHGAPTITPASHPAPADPHAAAAKPAVHAAPHWDYKDAATWGDLSPEFAACKTGKQQSPVDILPERGQATDIAFDYHPVKATAKDNGHTYQVDVEPGSSIVIDDKSYKLIQFHVHTPSEHTLAGEAYAAEVHLVHKSAKGELAVIGVLVDRGAANPGLALAWKKFPRPDKPEALKKPFDPTTLLPSDRSVYRYEGSLTTPPCGEGVNWNVMRHSVTHTGRDIDVVHARFGDNARPVQALGERKVL